MPLATPKVGLGGRVWHGLGRSAHTIPGEEGCAQPVRKQLLCLLCARHGAVQKRYGKAAKGGAAHSDTPRAEGRCKLKLADVKDASPNK